MEDLTKAMATGQMWTQAQPAERACRGAAAAERRLNGVAYTQPPRVVSLRKLRDSYDTYRVDNDLDLAGALRAQICFAGRAPRAVVPVERHAITRHPSPYTAYQIRLTFLGISWLHDAFRHQSHLSKAIEGMLWIS